MPFASFPKRRGEMFVAVCTTPKASPSPTRPHKTWSFLGSPDCTTPPPEELLEKYYNESPPTCDPFSDHHLSDEPLYEEPYLSRSHLQGPPSTTTCPYPEDPFALLNHHPPVSSAFSPLRTPPPPPSVEASSPDRIAIINLNNNNNQSLRLANHLSAHFPTLLYTPSPSSYHHHHHHEAAGHPLLTTTSNPALLSRADYLILPASAHTTAPLRRAVAVIAAHARPGATVVVESSGSALPVGTTRALLGGLHARRGVLGGVVVRGAKAEAAVVGLYGRVCPAVLAVAGVEVAGVEVAERVGAARGGGGRGFHGW